MDIRKIFLSKLIKVCDIDWIADSDALYGEQEFSPSPRRELKKLVYKHQGRENLNSRHMTKNSLRSTDRNRKMAIPRGRA